MSKTDKATLKLIAADLEKAANEVAAKYGFKAKVGNIRFSTGAFDTSLSFTSELSEQHDYDLGIQHGKLMGYDVTKTIRGNPLTLVRYDSKRHTRPWIYASADGTLYTLCKRDIEQRCAKIGA